MTVTTKQYAGIFKEGEPFPNYLPYEEKFDEVFINRDGSFGKVWELTVPDCELKDENELLEISNQLEMLSQRLVGEKADCQVILCSDSYITEQLNNYMNLTSPSASEFVKDYAKQKIDYFEKSKEGFFKDEPNFCTKRIRVIFTLHYYPYWVHPSLSQQISSYIQGYRSVGEFIQQDFYKEKAELVRIGEKLISVFESTGFLTRELNSDEFTILLYRILNPDRCKLINTPRFNPDEAICDQIVYSSPKKIEGGFLLDKHNVKVVTLKEVPNGTTPGMFTQESNLGNNECLLDLNKNFMMVFNISVPEPGTVMRDITFQKAIAFLHSMNPLGDKNVEAEEKKQDYDNTIREIYTGGQKIVNARVHFVFMDEDELRLERTMDQLLLNLNRFGCEGVKETGIGDSLFLTCLPLNFDHYWESSIRRDRRLLSKSLTDMLPVYGSIKGTKTPAQIYVNRRGGIVTFNPFDSNTNPHCVMFGGSGAGKSFLCIDMILQQLRLGTHIFVLDKGESYKKLCLSEGGQYVSFDINNPIRINPFYRKPDSENIAFLVNLLSQMASGGDERDRLSREEEGIIQRAIYKAYELFDGSTEIILSDVVNIIKSQELSVELGIQDMGRRIALKLEPFTKDGAYGKFFDGENQFDFTKQLTVFELANLSSHSDLQSVVFQNIMFYMTGFVSSPKMKPIPKIVIIDEAWHLMEGKSTGSQITLAFKTFRKSFCAVIAVTQELADLINHVCGKAILANVANIFILKQAMSVIPLLESGLSLNKRHIKLIKTLRMVKPRYSEFLLITDSSEGICRMYSQPRLYWLANTETKNNAFLENQIIEKGDLISAINYCAKEFPYGI